MSRERSQGRCCLSVPGGDALHPPAEVFGVFMGRGQGGGDTRYTQHMCPLPLMYNTVRIYNTSLEWLSNENLHSTV